MGPIEFQGHYSIDLAIHQLQLWRFVSYQFLHANFMHLFFNMWVLWQIGQLMERLLGQTGFFILYFASGLAAGALALEARNWSAPVVSASGTNQRSRRARILRRSRQPLMRIRVNQTSNGHASRYDVMCVNTLTNASCTASSASAASRRYWYAMREARR